MDLNGRITLFTKVTNHGANLMQTINQIPNGSFVHPRYTRQAVVTLLHHQCGSQRTNSSTSIAHKQIRFANRKTTTTSRNQAGGFILVLNR